MASLATVEPTQIANVEEEAALLGALLNERSLIDPIADRVNGGHFAEPLHGRIFDAIVKLHSEGKSANVLTVKSALSDDPGLAEVGASYLVTISTGTMVAASVLGARDFADEIRELSQKRLIAERLREVIVECHSTSSNARSIVDAVEQALTVEGDTESKRMLSAADCVSRVLDGFGKQEHGVSSGIEPIDAGLGAVLPQQLVILAGRPSMGKSAVASSYALGAASRGHGTLFVSLEMSAEELGERIAADICFDSPVQVPYQAITDRRVTPEQSRHIARALDRLEQMPLTIVDTPSCTISKLNALVRRHARRLAARGKKLELVVVDYLQLIRPDRNTENRTQEITQVSMGLKALAKEHGVCVMALAQLSRSVEQRADKRPIMADLRESGQIEQDADAIMFLYRPEYYLQQSEPTSGDRSKWDELMDDARGKIEFIVAKRRRGRTGTTQGRFYGAFQAVR
jgi:replicative DNA helicase